MRKFLTILLLTGVCFTINAQSTQSILEKYAESEEVSKMTLTGDVLRMFAQEYEQREIIDKVKKIDVYIFGDEQKLKDSDLSLIKANLKNDNYEELINLRDEGNKVKVLVKERGDTIKRLFMLFEGSDSQTVVAEMKCSLTYDDLQKLQLEFDGVDGLKYINGKNAKKM